MNNANELQKIYVSRPFKTRNADEYDLSAILKLFVNPLDGLTTPFDFENSIIKGRMGSGKTMYLRANHAYYLFSLLPTLESGEPVILPVMIRLSDFQHLNTPQEIYRSIIIKVIEELTSIYEHLQNVKDLGRIHMGMKSLVADPAYMQKMGSALRKLVTLGSEEYVDKLTSEIGLKGGAKPGFFELSIDYKQTKFSEIKQKPNPGIKDIEECYRRLFDDSDAKILLLIDEAGALDKQFFKEAESASLFEVLMNQFRTANFIRTKIALYPHSYSDILTETRYGDVVKLEENIYDITSYKGLRRRTIEIIANYTGQEEETVAADEIFEIEAGNDFGDGVEQLIYASNGNLRRLIQLLDSAMSEAYAIHKGFGRVALDSCLLALQKNSSRQEEQYTVVDRDFLEVLSSVCKSRSTFRFQFPYMSPVLSKFTNRSQEFNVINVLELGSGRKGTTYAFDYSFCVSHDIPTHYLKNTEKIDRERSLKNGDWISRVSGISNDIIEQAKIPGKINGEIEYANGKNAFVRGEDGKEYFTNVDYIIESDREKPLTTGKAIRFFPTSFDSSSIAIAVEIL
ncbi:hypothetical protein [Paraburkholderia sp. GAS348]|uniref:hypothetical protein n=1 Tax=Paraburkholderia sp. GAS348 TaxID=3035132 RepID=UPI003D1C59C4